MCVCCVCVVVVYVCVVCGVSAVCVSGVCVWGWLRDCLWRVWFVVCV